MRYSISRLPLVLTATVTLVCGGCGGSAIKRDAKQLKSKCGVVQGQVVSEDQARCIARLHGVEEKRNCPLEVDRPEEFGEPVYRIRESCNGLGLVVSHTTGRVLAVVAGDDVVYE